MEAGRFLAPRLASYADQKDADVIVLGLARGGVPIGNAIARALNVSLDVLVVRKLGVPGHEELAMGAIASRMVRVLKRDVRLRPAKTGEMGRCERQYLDSRILQDLEHKIVILTDGGPATGATMRAAVMSLRQRKIARCVVAVISLAAVRKAWGDKNTPSVPRLDRLPLAVPPGRSGTTAISQHTLCDFGQH